MLDCWNHDPWLRPTFTDLVNRLDAILSSFVSQVCLFVCSVCSHMRCHYLCLYTELVTREWKVKESSYLVKILFIAIVLGSAVLHQKVKSQGH